MNCFACANVSLTETKIRKLYELYGTYRLFGNDFSGRILHPEADTPSTSYQSVCMLFLHRLWRNAGHEMAYYYLKCTSSGDSVVSFVYGKEG